MKKVDNAMEKVDKLTQKAMRYDIADVMRRYAEHTRLPQEALDEHEREIKRFLVMCAANPGMYAMRGPLDELWHTFIIFTSSYAKFCRLLGGRFIHHQPTAPEEAPPKKARTQNSYQRFLKDYQLAFAEEAPAHIWPRPGGGAVGTTTCDNCGSWCDHTCIAMELLPNERRVRKIESSMPMDRTNKDPSHR
jgi:hypothetical protein